MLNLKRFCKALCLKFNFLSKLCSTDGGIINKKIKALVEYYLNDIKK